MPELENLTATEIAAILPPDEPDLGPGDLQLALPRRIAYLDTASARLKRVTELYDAWGRHLGRRPPPPPVPESLRDLVATARDTLRRRRLTFDRNSLVRRNEVLTAVRTELVR